MVAKRLAPLIWFTKNDKKHIRLRGLPDAPAIPLIDRKQITALAAVKINIETFLEVENIPQESSKKAAPSLDVSTDTDLFLVFPCTIMGERTRSQTFRNQSNPLINSHTQ